MKRRIPNYPIYKFTETEYSKKLSYKGIGLRWHIAEVIFEGRLKHNITQKELAAKMKTQQSVISRIENAKTYPSLSFLAKIAEALDIQFYLRIGKQPKGCNIMSKKQTTH
jgi:ribosome-binding protein aMBF1 (putative translation factor)